MAPLDELRWDYGIRWDSRSAWSPADPGPEGLANPPGEVTQQQFNDPTAGTANNPADVETLDLTPNDPPTTADFLMLPDKLNELLSAFHG